MRDASHLVAPEPEGYAPTSFDAVGTFPHDWLEHRAAITPDRVAATQTGRDWTFTQLRDRMNGYAAVVSAARIAPGTCVGVVSGSTLDMLAAWFGIMRAGGVAVLLDAVDGAQRIGAVLDEVDPPLVLADRASLDLLGRRGRNVTTFEDVAPEVTFEGPELTMGHAGRLLFTSGSTGRPKGLVQTHGVLIDWMLETVSFDNVFSGDRVGNPTSIPSAASSSQLLGSIFTGAHLFQFDVHREGVEAIGAWTSSSALTWLKCAPAVLRNVLRAHPDPASYATLRVVRLTGDRVLPSDLEAILAVVPDTCRVAMHYGSSEAGPIARLLWAPGEPVPAGRLTVGWLLPGRSVRVLDEHGAPLPAGEIGLVEVCKSGVVARPYTGPESLVAQDDPHGEPVVFGDLGRVLADGQIDIVGRTNARVKIHGRAVDLVEIEQVVRAVPGVATAAVVLEPDAERPRLVAHVVRSDVGLTAPQLLEACRPHLATYMVPSLVRWWDQLPVSTRGKVDRRALEAASVGLDVAGGHVGAGDALEASLLAIWQEVLGVGGIGVTDRFFDVGGDSLRAYQLVVLIEERLGAEVSTATLLTAPTVREQAGLIREGRGRRGVVLLPLRPEGAGPAVCFVHGRGGSALVGAKLLPWLPQGRPVWGLHLDDAQRASELGSLGDLAEAYVNELVGGRVRGPVALVGWSLGGMVAWEMALRMPAAGLAVERVVVLDTAVAAAGPDVDPVSGLRQVSYVTRRTARRLAWQLGRVARNPRWAWRSLRRRVASADERPDSVVRIESALGALAIGWTPAPGDFPVDVVASEGRVEQHRRVWTAATSGPARVTGVRSTYHFDLMTNAIEDTGRIVGAALG